jgi:uncharacterized protein (DUF433 family)
MTMRTPATNGAYDAARAAALSGVPKSTIHYWSRTDVVVPSVSASKVKLWSHTDLLCLRAVYWLRQPKSVDDAQIPATTMPKVRAILERLRGFDVAPVALDGTSRVFVDESGEVYAHTAGVLATGRGQIRLPYLDVLGPFETGFDTLGPDLFRPRPRLRIIPGKLSGAPHLADTRLETFALRALHQRGFKADDIHELYPFAEPDAIGEAIELEEQLGRNVAA